MALEKDTALRERTNISLNGGGQDAQYRVYAEYSCGLKILFLIILAKATLV